MRCHTLDSLESRQASMEVKQSSAIKSVAEQQGKMEDEIKLAVGLIKQVSDDHQDHGKKISALEDTKRQLSEEVAKTGEFVHQLSLKDDEMQGKIEDLEENVCRH